MRMTSVTSLPVAVCALLGLGAAVPAVAGTTTAGHAAHGAPTPQWPARQFVPSPGHGGFLSGAWCISSANCWAVGSYANTAGAELNQALHWNGRKWSRVATPDPGGTTSSGDSSALNSIACTSSRNCVTVGSFGSAGHSAHNQALRWNGRRWALVATPGPGGGNTASFSELLGVRCPSASDCWAVGTYAKSSSAAAPGLNQMLHWNGRNWTTVRVPNPAGTADGASNLLRGASCTSAVNCWAVGFATRSVTAPTLNEALHWNGRKWATVTVPEPAGTAIGDTNSLSGVFCSLPGNCWAVGYYVTPAGQTITQLNQALHWNGRKWRKAATPDPGGTGGGEVNGLSAVVCTSTANCWAVGAFGTFSGGTAMFLNQALHWNGHAWFLVSTPDPAGTANNDINALAAVRCASAALCWAVGQQVPNGQAGGNEALRWNGKHWSAR